MIDRRDIRSYARTARDLLQNVAEGIGRLEANVERLPAMLPRDLPRSISRRLPRRLRPERGLGLAGKLLVAGVAVSTVALIFSSVQSGRRRGVAG